MGMTSSPAAPPPPSERVARLDLGEIRTVHTHAGALRYVAKGSGWRFDTILSKEPETIEWIDSFAPGEILWDIGANVGIYSLYAALRGVRVLAFEPHFANYFQLCANIAANDMAGSVIALCLACSRSKQISTLNLADVAFGASMSSFGSDLDFRGDPFAVQFRQGMVGYDLDSFCVDFDFQPPDHIKIDVDGIELDIVQGAQGLLALPQVKSVSIELVETDQAQVDGVTRIMAACGLAFMHKRQNPIFRDSPTGDVLNYLFRRPA